MNDPAFPPTAGSVWPPDRRRSRRESIHGKKSGRACAGRPETGTARHRSAVYPQHFSEKALSAAASAHGRTRPEIQPLMKKRGREKEQKTLVLKVQRFSIRSPPSGFFPDDIDRLIQDVVTPKYRATSAPEYPSSLTATHDSTSRAFTTACLRPPDSSSPAEISYFLQTSSAGDAD